MSRVALLAVFLALSACNTAPSTELRPGRYSGSTATDEAITIEVAGSQIRVNSRRATLARVDDNRKFVATRMKDKPSFSCEPADDGKELRCEVRWPGRTESIELMKE